MLFRSAISAVKPKWMKELCRSYEGDEHWQSVIAQCLLDSHTGSDYQILDGIIKYKGKLVVGSANGIRNSLLKAVHDTALGGHSGQRGTYQKLRALFHWEGMKQDVIKFVSACDVCQRCKHENVPYPGLL